MSSNPPGFSAVSWSSPAPRLCWLVSGRSPAAEVALGRGHRDRVGAAVAEPEQLEGVGEVTEPEGDPELVCPFFDGVGDDLQGSAAGSANQVVVVAGPAGKPVAGFAVVTAEGVDRAGSGQRPKLMVDGGYPDPQALGGEEGSETIMKFGGAEEPVGGLQDFEQRPFAGGVPGPHQWPAVAATLVWPEGIAVRSGRLGGGLVAHPMAESGLRRSMLSSPAVAAGSRRCRFRLVCCTAVHTRATV